MNIEIANRLVNLRKSNNLSQEALAEKLGISRQAVSKWERAEASPDTDNLILLARLYGVSLDELLQTEDEIPMSDTSEYEETESWGDGENEEYVHVGFRGVHVKDKDSEVHVGWDGIHVNDKRKGDEVHGAKAKAGVGQKQLGDKAAQQRQTHHGKAAQGKAHAGQGGTVCTAPQIVQLLSVAGDPDHLAGTKEEQRLGKGVHQNLEEGGGHAGDAGTADGDVAVVGGGDVVGDLSLVGHGDRGDGSARV